MRLRASDLTDAARARTTSLRQGDVLRTPILPLVTVPTTSLHREELGEAAGSAILTPVAVELPSHLVAVISGDCDLERSIDVEPTFVVAPVVDLPEVLHRSARDGVGSSRVFAFPPLSPRVARGEELPHPGIDARWLFTLEKTALLSDQVEVIPCPLDSPSRDRLRLWLGRRLGRIGFPDDIQRHVVEPLVDAILRPKTAPSEVERLRQAAAFYGIRWTEGSPVVNSLVVLDPARRTAAGLDGGAIRGARTAIRQRLLGRTAAYQVTGPAVADADQIALLDASGYRQFFLDPFDPTAGEEF